MLLPLFYGIPGESAATMHHMKDDCNTQSVGQGFQKRAVCLEKGFAALYASSTIFRLFPPRRVVVVLQVFYGIPGESAATIHHMKDDCNTQSVGQGLQKRAVCLENGFAALFGSSTIFRSFPPRRHGSDRVLGSRKN